MQLDEPALVADRTPAELNAAARAYRELGGARRPAEAAGRLLLRPARRRAARAGQGARSRAWPWTSPGPPPPTWTTWPPSAGCPASGWSPGWSTAATSGAPTWRRRWPPSAPCSAWPTGWTSPPSCSLLHVPLDAAAERDVDPQVAPLARLRPAEGRRGRHRSAAGLAEGTGRHRRRARRQPRRPGLPRRPRRSPATRPYGPGPRRSPTPTRAAPQPYAERAAAQRARLGLPLLPTTTIGSFPQTAELRRARADLRAGRLDAAGYDERDRGRDPRGDRLPGAGRAGRAGARRARTQRHGPVLRRAARPATSPPQHGWVQSYGTRYVRPPILAGDVSRPEPMTVELDPLRPVARPTGRSRACSPGRSRCWPGRSSGTTSRSADTARQVALALRDEVGDLEAAGTAVIQVDEPALRETLPLRAADRAGVPGVGDRGVPAGHLRRARRTPRSTRTCATPSSATSSGAIDDLDADVISLEAARSHMQVAGRTGRRRLSARGRPRRLRHPLAAGARAPTRSTGAAAHGARGHPGRAAVGQPRLRPEDPRLARGPGRPWRTWSPPPARSGPGCPLEPLGRRLVRRRVRGGARSCGTRGPPRTR